MHLNDLTNQHKKECKEYGISEKLVERLNLVTLEHFARLIIGKIRMRSNQKNVVEEDIDGLYYDMEKDGISRKKINKEIYFKSIVLTEQEFNDKITKEDLWVYNYFSFSLRNILSNNNKSFLITMSMTTGEEIFVEVMIKEGKNEVETFKDGVVEEVDEVVNYNPQEEAVLDAIDEKFEIIKDSLVIIKQNIHETDMAILTHTAIASFKREMAIFGGINTNIGWGLGDELPNLFEEIQRIINNFKELKDYGEMFGIIVSSDNFKSCGVDRQTIGGDRKQLAMFGLECRKEKIESGLKLKLGELMTELKEIVAEHQ